MAEPSALEDQASGVQSAAPSVRESQAPPEEARPWHRRRIWELRPLQDAIAVLLTVLIVWLVWKLRAATIPALIALLLAYIFDPFVTWAKARWKFPRMLTTALCVVFVLALMAGTLAWLVPRVIRDGVALARSLPSHMQRASEWLESTELARFAESLQDVGKGADTGDLLSGAFGLAGAFAGAVGVAAYGLISLAFGIAVFAYLSVCFPRLPRASWLIPKSQRETTLELLSRFEAAIGGFLRGQVIVAIFTTTGFIAGFSIAGVPHAPLAGVIGGMFSFVPNGQLSGLLLAWGFGVLKAGPDFQALPVFLYPAIVYAITQSLETFVITPLVQGSQTRLHPLLVLAALIAGGSVGGLLGVFLAIPVAACAKILLDQVVWPELRHYLERS